ERHEALHLPERCEEAALAVEGALPLRVDGRDDLERDRSPVRGARAVDDRGASPPELRLDLVAPEAHRGSEPRHAMHGVELAHADPVVEELPPREAVVRVGLEEIDGEGAGALRGADK